jgi:hypothetical protein
LDYGAAHLEVQRFFWPTIEVINSYSADKGFGGYAQRLSIAPFKMGGGRFSELAAKQSKRAPIRGENDYVSPRLPVVLLGKV